MSDLNSRPAIDTLIDRERIRGASRMIAEGTAAEAVTSDQIDRVRQDVDTFCAHHKINRKALSVAVGYAHGVISDFLADKYRGDNAKVATVLDAWLVEEEARRARPKTTQFVETNTVRQIVGVATYCLDYQKIGLVYGPETSGIGKTTALQFVHQKLGTRRSTLVTIDKVDANVTGLLHKICQAMHVNDSGSNKNKFGRIKGELLGRSHLLMIDQIHNLRGSKEDKPFYVLADLFDATGTAQLWCGTADLVGYLTRQQRKLGDESLAQIRRRIFPCVDLMDALATGGDDGKGEPLVTIDQVKEMFAKNRLKLADPAARFLCVLVNQPDNGGIGTCVQLVEYATMLGEVRSAKSIDVALLKSAMRHGISAVRADTIIREVEAAESTQRLSRVG